MTRALRKAFNGGKPPGFGPAFTVGAFVGDIINTVDFNSGSLRWRAVLFNSSSVKDATAPITVGTESLTAAKRPYVFAAGAGGAGGTGSGSGGGGGGGGGSVFLGRLSAAAAITGDSIRLAVAPADDPTRVKARTTSASLSVLAGRGGAGGAAGGATGSGVSSTVAAGIDGSTMTAHGASGGGAGYSGAKGLGATWTNGIGSGTVVAGNDGGEDDIAGGGGGGGGSALFAGISSVSAVGGAGRVGQPVSAYAFTALSDLLVGVGLPSQYGVGGAGGGFGAASGGVGIIDGDGGAVGQAGSVGTTGEGSGGDGNGSSSSVAGGNGLVVLMWPTGFAT